MKKQDKKDILLSDIQQKSATFIQLIKAEQ